MTFNDQIAVNIAEKFGFECTKSSIVVGGTLYIYTRETIIPITNYDQQNPCAEIPLHHNFIITIEADKFFIHRRDFVFDLYDPMFMDYLAIVFEDLDALRSALNDQKTSNWFHTCIMRTVRKNAS